MLDIEEVLENPAFWILAAIGVVAETIGWIMSRSWESGGMPVYQFIALVLGTIVIAAFWANRG